MFFLGLFLGFFLGVMVMCMLQINRADDVVDKYRDWK